MRSALILVSVSLFAFSASPLSVQAQEELRWKFQSGETLKYLVQQKMQTEMSVAGQKVNSTMQQSMDMSWKVGTVSPIGNATVSQTVERVKMKMEGGPFGAIEFDTSSTEVPANQIVKAMADVFRKIVGQEFQVTMLPSGKVQDVQVPKELLSSITSGIGGASPLNEDTLKQMMEQSSVMLPGGVVKVGETWNSSQQVELPFGQMTVSSQMTYEGKDASTGMAKIAMKPTISVTPKEGAPIQVSLTKSEGVGRVLFDAARGRIVRSDLNLTLQMQVSQQGQVIDQSIKQDTTMQLGE